MHELSIAHSIVSEIERALASRGAVSVAAVHLRVGALSTVVPSALAFAFDVAAEGTIAQGAVLDIVCVPVTVWCEPCGALRELRDLAAFACPTCETPTADVRAGLEMELTSVELCEGGPCLVS